MRLMISGGGTGGHVYPALAVVQTLDPKTEILWVGSETGMEKALIARANIPFRGISAAGLRGKNPLAAVSGLVKLSRGFLQSRRLLANFKPDVLFVTGGYVCAPVTWAAHRKRIPVLIYLPDIQPGQAIKHLSRYADKIAVTAPPAQTFFPPGLTVVTGYPAREGLIDADAAGAKRRLNLAPDLPVTLAWGGSQGARSINKAVAQSERLQRLLNQTQLIHISGKSDAVWTQAVKQALPETLQKRYHLYPYLHEGMVDAFAAADLIICRAGASTLGEIPASGTASILVPYPHSGAHQWPNAQYLQDQGAALIIKDDELDKLLIESTLNLLTNPQKRLEMAEAARRLARPEAAQAIAVQIKELGYGSN